MSGHSLSWNSQTAELTDSQSCRRAGLCAPDIQFNSRRRRVWSSTITGLHYCLAVSICIMLCHQLSYRRCCSRHKQARTRKVPELSATWSKTFNTTWISLHLIIMWMNITIVS